MYYLCNKNYNTYKSIHIRQTIILANLTLKHHLFPFEQTSYSYAILSYSSFFSLFHLNTIFIYYYYVLSPLHPIFFLLSSSTFPILLLIYRQTKPTSSIDKPATNPLTHKTTNLQKHRWQPAKASILNPTTVSQQSIHIIKNLTPPLTNQTQNHSPINPQNHRWTINLKFTLHPQSNPQHPPTIKTKIKPTTTATRS